MFLGEFGTPQEKQLKNSNFLVRIDLKTVSQVQDGGARRRPRVQHRVHQAGAADIQHRSDSQRLNVGSDLKVITNEVQTFLLDGAVQWRFVAQPVLKRKKQKLKPRNKIWERCWNWKTDGKTELGKSWNWKTKIYKQNWDGRKKKINSFGESSWILTQYYNFYSKHISGFHKAIFWPRDALVPARLRDIDGTSMPRQPSRVSPPASNIPPRENLYCLV